MAEEYWSAERVGRELNPDAPLTPESARKEMQRAGIRAVHGYPASAVKLYRRRRPGRGFRSDLKTRKPGPMTMAQRQASIEKLTTRLHALEDEMANAPQPKRLALNNERIRVKAMLIKLGVRYP